MYFVQSPLRRLGKNSNGRTVGALYERAFLVESTNWARSQTAPTVKSVPLSSFSAAAQAGMDEESEPAVAVAEVSVKAGGCCALALAAARSPGNSSIVRPYLRPGSWTAVESRSL